MAGRVDPTGACVPRAPVRAAASHAPQRDQRSFGRPCTATSSTNVSAPRKSPGLAVYSGRALLAAVAAIMRSEARAGIRLAFVAALQYLSARQRAVLILRDVLEWPAAQVADLLGTTTTAVNSGLRRARAQLAQALPAEDELAEPAEPDRRAVLDRFAAAIEGADGSALAELLREDVALEMPPLLTWFTGRQTVAGFIAAHFLTEPGGLRLVPVMANGERAFAVYQREPGGAYHAHA